MHTAQEIRAAAKFAGCQVRRLELVHTQTGPTWCGQLECSTSWSTFRLLQKLAEFDESDPVVRDRALRLLRQHGPDQEAVARAIHAWVKAHVVYLREPRETFQSARYTIATRAGDCDDHATLSYVLARNAGLRARIAPLTKGNGTDEHVCHAVAQVRIGGDWRWMETTVDAQFGEHPVAAVKRLRVARGDIAS